MMDTFLNENLNKNTICDPKKNFNCVELYNKTQTQKSGFEGYLITWRNAHSWKEKIHCGSKFVKTEIAIRMRHKQENNLRFRVTVYDPFTKMVCGNRDGSGIIPSTLAQVLR